MRVPLDRCPARYGALNYPEREAWIGPNGSWSYKELDQRVNVLCQRLLNAGVRPKDYLVTVSDDQPTILLFLLAAMRLGFILAPLNNKLPAPMLKQQLATFDGGWCYCPERSIPDLQMKHLTQELFTYQHRQYLLSAEVNGKLEPYWPLTAIFTSGSSGPPKAAIHCYANHYFSAVGSQSRIPLEPKNRWLISLPLYHVGGLAVLFRSLQVGSTLVGLASQRQLANTLVSCRVSHLSLVSTQLERLLTIWEQTTVPPTLRFLLLGGGQIPPRLLMVCGRLGLQPYVSYGLTEMSSQVCTGQVNLEETVGDVLPERELMLSPQGQILVRGRTLFLGYLIDGKLSLPVDSDGWFATNDRGHWHLKYQQLVVDGRLDNMFVSGGENIQPEWVERQLLELDGVRRALVVPVPDPDWGNAMVAFIDAPEDSLQTVLRRAHALLSSHLYPKHWLNWPAKLDIGLKPNRKQFIALAKLHIQQTKQQ